MFGIVRTARESGVVDNLGVVLEPDEVGLSITNLEALAAVELVDRRDHALDLHVGLRVAARPRRRLVRGRLRER